MTLGDRTGDSYIISMKRRLKLTRKLTKAERKLLRELKAWHTKNRTTFIKWPFAPDRA